MVTNEGGGVWLFKATDLSAIGSYFLSTATFGACSDGVSFWVSLQGPGQIGRF